MKFISEKALAKGHAKINLHLDITGIEKDGYHSVNTVMQSISLFDTVTVTLTDGEFSAESDAAGVPTDEKNIAVRAAMLFMKEIKSDRGAFIKIDKRIPMEAGMAGGSADGAATLKALNSMLDTPMSTEALCVLARKLGADVPFCVVGGSAFADGRGDILHPFPSLPDCVIVAARGGEGVSTPWGYRLLDSVYGGFSEDCGYTPRSLEPLRKVLSEDAPSLSRIGENL